MLNNYLKLIRMKDYLMNKKQFAEFLEIDDRQYNRYENSVVQPSLEIALKIAQKLNKNVNEIWEIQRNSDWYAILSTYMHIFLLTCIILYYTNNILMYVRRKYMFNIKDCIKYVLDYIDDRLNYSESKIKRKPIKWVVWLENVLKNLTNLWYWIIRFLRLVLISVVLIIFLVLLFRLI